MQTRIGPDNARKPARIAAKNPCDINQPAGTRPVSADSVEVDLEMATSLGIVVTELVSNAGGLTDEHAVELLVRWIRYAYYRDDSTWQSFNAYLEHLAQQEHLFNAQCRILRRYDYVTMVILTDQAEKLVDQPRMTQALMNLWDRDAQIGVNLFFVFAGTKEVRRLWDESIYGGFVRRFLDPRHSTVVRVTLDQPNLDGGYDDLARVRGSLENIAGRFPDHMRLRKTDDQIAAIRDSLVRDSSSIPSF
jgi:hypothetical protein